MSELTLTLRRSAQVGEKARSDFVLGTQEHLPGTVVRGAFAAAWIARRSGQPPGRTGEDGQQVTPMFRVGEQYVLPGTGLKGLLRSRTEYILRSVGAEPAPCLDRRCGPCWTCTVFGHGGGQDTDARSVGARALVRVPDVVVVDPVEVVRQHVAVDRFTGGAQEGLLYAVEALESGTFDLVVEPLGAGLGGARAAEVRALLRLALEDLDDGLAGIGAGVARGYGSVRVGLADAEARGGLPGGALARQVLRDMAPAAQDQHKSTTHASAG